MCKQLPAVNSHRQTFSHATKTDQLNSIFVGMDVFSRNHVDCADQSCAMICSVEHIDLHKIYRYGFTYTMYIEGSFEVLRLENMFSDQLIL